MNRTSLEEKIELFNGSPVVAYTCEPAGDFATTFISENVRTQLGWEPADFLADAGFWGTHIHPDDKGRVLHEIAGLFETGDRTLEYRFRHKDGSYRWLNDTLRLERNDSGEPVRIIGYWTDISAQKRATEALRDSEVRYRQMAELSPDGIFVHVDDKIVYANARLAQILAVNSPADLFGTPAIELTAPEYREMIKRQRSQVLDGEITNLERSEFLRADGSRVPVSRTGAPITWEGKPAILVLVRDVSDRVDIEQALLGSRDQLRLVTDNLPVLIVYIDAENRYRFVNKTCSEWYGRPIREILDRTVPEVLGEEYAKLNHQVRRTLSGKQLTFVETITYPDGVTRTVQITYVPHRGESGNIEGYFSLTEDISELKQAEETLRHALKMEAVGQLTGGVAHDFNNLLAVILGNAELLQDEIGDNLLLNQIDHAATRGAELTQRLLAFSRQQALQQRDIKLDELIPSLDDLFRRTLGEQVTIRTDVPEATWPVLADPGQLENALLNLAINARDAMPDGGILEIECANIEIDKDDPRFGGDVAAGDYVEITVRDTGIGMPEDVCDHAFEPFFTTKDVGEGSGLGLSMVYGFARQSGGDATIFSKPGKGTEIRLFLPRSEVTTMTDDQLNNSGRKRGQGEAILVLEDDPDVRSFAVNALQGLGYRVREAADATAAMQVIEEEAGKLDLLLSDVVLPGGVSGPELAAKAKDLHPGIKLVFMSGYAADLYTEDKIPGFDDILLTKPFRLNDLANAVHETLNR